MAMTMSGEQQLPASRETVWAKLNDPEVLKACIPGCQSLEVTGPNEFLAVATNKVGPVKATRSPVRAMAGSRASPRAAPA